MIDYKDIRDVHLELSTNCNASCPQCPRNYNGYPYNDGYPETNMTLESAKRIFTEDFLKQLDSIRINGNYGDIVMNSEGPAIVEYFKSVNPLLFIDISTNGSARSAEFWQRLARAGTRVLFAIDGLEDVHHLYRQNTSWKKIIENAKTYIAAGGRATWKMIKFNHNAHQVETCNQMASELGFYSFQLVDHGRDTGPVFNKQGQLTHVLGNYAGPTEFEVMFYKKRTDLVLLEDIVPGKIPKKSVKCEAKTLRSIYITATGDVSPCCWTGFYPKTFGHGEYYQAVNAQFADMIVKNNALEYPVETCVEWFKQIENSWQQTTYEQGRLVVCDDNCGQ